MLKFRHLRWKHNITIHHLELYRFDLDITKVKYVCEAVILKSYLMELLIDLLYSRYIFNKLKLYSVVTVSKKVVI